MIVTNFYQVTPLLRGLNPFYLTLKLNYVVRYGYLPSSKVLTSIYCTANVSQFVPNEVIDQITKIHMKGLPINCEDGTELVIEDLYIDNGVSALPSISASLTSIPSNALKKHIDNFLTTLK